VTVSRGMRCIDCRQNAGFCCQMLATRLKHANSMHQKSPSETFSCLIFDSISVAMIVLRPDADQTYMLLRMPAGTGAGVHDGPGTNGGSSTLSGRRGPAGGLQPHRAPGRRLQVLR